MIFRDRHLGSKPPDRTHAKLWPDAGWVDRTRARASFRQQNSTIVHSSSSTGFIGRFAPPWSNGSNQRHDFTNDTPPTPRGTKKWKKNCDVSLGQCIVCLFSRAGSYRGNANASRMLSGQCCILASSTFSKKIQKYSFNFVLY